MAVLILGEGHSGQSVVAKPGDSLEVQLPENGTTGYRWAAEAHSDLPLDESALPPPAPAGAVGAGRGRLFRSRPLALGEFDLALGLRRSWEKGGVPQRTFEVHVKVAT